MRAVLAAAGSLFLASSAGGQKISADSLRVELTQVITVRRMPAGPESLWVALVSRRPPADLLLARFNRDNPFFLTYLLENGTTFKHHAYLQRAPALPDPRVEFYRQLGADSQFIGLLAEAVNTYAAASNQPTRPAVYTSQDLLTFASRFIRVDADTSGRLGFSVCAKSSQLLELPFPSTPALEAWIYSIVRGGVDGGTLATPVAELQTNLAKLSPARDSAVVARIRRSTWQQLLSSREFASHVNNELQRRESYLPFTRR